MRQNSTYVEVIFCYSFKFSLMVHFNLSHNHSDFLGVSIHMSTSYIIHSRLYCRFKHIEMHFSRFDLEVLNACKSKDAFIVRDIIN